MNFCEKSLQKVLIGRALNRAIHTGKKPTLLNVYE